MECKEFERLVYVPNGISKACRLVEKGREVLHHQSEFWKRYAQIEDTYAKSLHSLLAQPCATWESKDGLFSKKKVLQETTKAMDQGWKAVKNAVQDLALRHEQIAGALLQQGHIPLEKFIHDTEAEVRQLIETSNQSTEAIATNFKVLQKARQQYIKLAQSHKALSKALDDPQLAYEKRQKMELQSSQLKGELDNALKAYRNSVDTAKQLQRSHYTKTAPQMLQKLEKLEYDRMEHTKVTYSKYGANTYTVIPTIRQTCDRLIYFTDQINPPNQVSQFVHSILFSLQEPLKAPKVPRFRPFGDTNGEDMEDDAISSHFHSTLFSIRSSYNISADSMETRGEPKPVRDVASGLEAATTSVETLDNDNPNSSDFVQEIETADEAEDEVQEADPPITSISLEDTVTDEIERREEETDYADESNGAGDSEPHVEKQVEEPVTKQASAGWIDDFLSGSQQTPGGPDEFSVPTSRPFENSSKISSQKKQASTTRVSLEKANTTPDGENTSTPNAETLSQDIEQKPPITETQQEVKEIDPMSQLKQLMNENDYYELFGVTAQDNLATIGEKRKEINRSLHPDNFTPNSPEKNAAVEKLVKVNDAFSSVFRNEKTKTLYDKLCAYRKKYDTLLDASDSQLQRAATNLNLVGTAIKRANFPNELHQEVSLLLQIIKDSRGIAPK